jgi:hypothetical protein
MHSGLQSTAASANEATQLLYPHRLCISDVGITLRVTDIAIFCTVQLKAHEDTRWQGGPVGRCWKIFLEEQDREEPNKESLELGLL